MNPLERPHEEYRHAFQRISELSLALLAELNERPNFPTLRARSRETGSPGRCLSMEWVRPLSMTCKR